MSEQKTERKANRLINSTSPYLLQHAYNPVDWYEWSEEALTKAKENDIPILVSIGYSSCHWCHVMERESFENEQIAALMNEHFVCVKVDREERPDIDQVYMDAIQAMGLNGGWPLNVFVMPDQKPFFGGTYFNPQSWLQLLTNIANAYSARRQEIESTSEELAKHLQRSDLNKIARKSNAAFKEDIGQMRSILESQFDNKWGGLSRAPKFILPSVWHWLMRYAHLTNDESVANHVLFTLKKIACGGIYDQVGGGFARYSVDERWFAPHFEKMLYDNAQLMSLYSEAYKISKEDLLKEVVYETFEWLTREMTSDKGGFYSALDADSEGVEGKFYTWTKDELDEILGENASPIEDYFGVTASGNWEHGRNILITNIPQEEFALQHSIEPGQLQRQIAVSKKKLLEARNKRIRPGLDDKILLGWNAMMVIGLLDAYDAFGDERFMQTAVKNIRFLEKELFEGTRVYRSYREKRSHVEGFLDDYAFLIKALIRTYQVTFDEVWLIKARDFTIYVLDHFFDHNEKYFHYGSLKAEKLIARRKELFDNVIPSSNSVMAQNLLHLGIILDNEWKQLAEQMISNIAGLIASEPVYMSNWGIVAMEWKHGLAEVAITGKNSHYLRNELAGLFQPFALLMGTENKSELPLLRDKTGTSPTIFVCYDKTCKVPVHTVSEAVDQLQ